MNTLRGASPSRTMEGIRVARDVLGLFKLRIGFMIMVTALVGMAVTPGPSPGWPKVLVLALAVLVASASAGAFNQYYERDSDRLMARTRGRAFVTGAVSSSPAWLLLMAALLAVAVGAAGWLLNAMAAACVFLGAFFYAVVYTVWLKRRSWLNIVIGGLAGSFAVLAGAAAVDPAIGPLGWLLATACSCGRRRISGASRSPTMPTTPPPACRCCPWWWASGAPRESSCGALWRWP